MSRNGHLTLLLAFICACTSLEVPEKIRLPVGQPFRHKFVGDHRRINVTDASGEDLPSWLTWDGNSVIEGVPLLSSVGETYLRVTEDHGTDSAIEVRVYEEVSNPCGDDRVTVWMEVHYDTDIDNLNAAQLMQVADAVSKYFQMSSEDLRLYPNDYKDKIRHSEVFESSMQRKANPRELTALWKISCDYVDDDATEVLERAVSMNDFGVSPKAVNASWVGWSVTKGSILSRKQRHDGGSGNVLSHFSGFATNEPQEETVAVTVPTSTARFTRTTTRADNHPVRLHSLPTFRCKRGAVCELTIPEETFMDPEDGYTRSLSLSVHAIASDKEWLLVDRGRQVLRGVPLSQGDFQFRLEARDSANQMTSAAFRVSVEDSEPSNHVFELDIQQTYERLMKDPETLLSFSEKLANSMGDALPRNVIIRNVEAGSPGRSVISWSNATLSNKVCQMKAIEAIKFVMLTKRREKIRSDFLRAMDSRFHVRNVTLRLLDSCLEEKIDQVELTTTPTTSSTEETLESAISSLWLPLSLALLFLLFILILVLICCLSRKRSQKTVQSEYVSKGLPVVFPEEIPQEDEAATVATPMLVKEERPPLIISQHENPLYKPPPPLSSTSSPRPRSAATNQRLPPPYVPP